MCIRIKVEVKVAIENNGAFILLQLWMLIYVTLLRVLIWLLLVICGIVHVKINTTVNNKKNDSHHFFFTIAHWESYILITTTAATTIIIILLIIMILVLSFHFQLKISKCFMYKSLDVKNQVFMITH